MNFDLSLKDVFLIVGDMLNLALGSLRSAKLLEFKQKKTHSQSGCGHFQIRLYELTLSDSGVLRRKWLL